MMVRHDVEHVDGTTLLSVADRTNTGCNYFPAFASSARSDRDEEREWPAGKNKERLYIYIYIRVRDVDGRGLRACFDSRQYPIVRTQIICRFLV